MTKKELADEKSFKAELKKVREFKEWYAKCKAIADEHGKAEEARIRALVISDLDKYEKQLVNILDGYKKRKSGDVYFTKDAECRYIEKSH